MRLLVFALILCLTVFGRPGVAALAQPGASPAASGELNLPQIMEKTLLAYGGKQNLARQEINCIMQGQEKVVSPDGLTASQMQFRQVRKGAALRIDLQVPGAVSASTSTVFDGTTGWKAGGKWASDLPAEAVRVLQEDRDRQVFVLAHWQEPGYTFGFLGRTQYKQTPVLAIEVGHAEHTPTTFFIDESNYLVVASSYQRRDPATGSPSTVDTEYSSYRPVGGTMIPFHQAQFANGQKTLEMSVEAVDLQTAVDDGLFRRARQAAPVRLDRPQTIPVDYASGELIVKVRLNDGEPLDFLLDTGASETMVDRRTAAEQSLDKQGNTMISVASGAVATSASIIRKLELGNLTLEGVHALVLDMSPQSAQLGRKVAGIIGSNVLSQFAVTIDYGRRAVILSDAQGYQAPEGAASAPVTERPGLMVKAVLDGRDEVEFLVDTGAAFNHLPAELGKKYAAGQPLRLTEGSGLDGRPVRLAEAVVDSVAIGKLSVPKVRFTYPYEGATHEGRGGFFETSQAGILGNPFWQNFVLTLDYRGRRLILQPAAGRKAGGEINQLITAGDTRLVIHRDYRAAEAAYQKALAAAEAAADVKNRARALGRLGMLHRVMAHDLSRPEQARVSYQYFNKAQALARSCGDRAVEGRILADWSLLYSDNGQVLEARQTMDAGLAMAPDDPYVNVDYAVHLYRAKLYAQMQRYVDKALSLDPSNWQALWYQVKLAELFYDTPKLKAALKEILRFYPWSRLAKEKLAALSPPAAPPASPAPAAPPASPAPGGLH